VADVVLVSQFYIPIVSIGMLRIFRLAGGIHKIATQFEIWQLLATCCAELKTGFENMLQ
jgi:hypothetical protein